MIAVLGHLTIACAFCDESGYARFGIAYMSRRENNKSNRDDISLRDKKKKHGTRTRRSDTT